MRSSRRGDMDPGALASAFALEVIERRHPAIAREGGPEAQPFHHAGHTQDVLERTEHLLTELARLGIAEIDARRRTLAAIAAAFHDIVRGVPALEAERASAEEAVAWMRDCGGFDSGDEAVVRAAIDATVPSTGAKMDRAMGATSDLGWAEREFRQPALFVPPPGADPVVSAALALADVATPGLDPPEVYRREGDTRFRECDKARELQRRLDEGGFAAAFADGGAAEAKRLILEWSKRQILFAEHLRDRYVEAVLQTIGGASAAAALFPTFDACIEDAGQRLVERHKMEEEALVRDIGFAVDP